MSMAVRISLVIKEQQVMYYYIWRSLCIYKECWSTGIPPTRGATVIAWLRLLLLKSGRANFSCTTLYNFIQSKKKIQAGFVTWFQFISVQPFPMYECHTVGVDVVKHRTLVVMIEIMDIGHHRRIQIPMTFQRLDLSLEIMKGKTYCFGPGKRRQTTIRNIEGLVLAWNDACPEFLSWLLPYTIVRILKSWTLCIVWEVFFKQRNTLMNSRFL